MSQSQQAATRSIFDSQGRLRLHNCWAMSPVTDIHRYVARIFSCPWPMYFIASSSFDFSGTVYVFTYTVCICMYEGVYMHLYVTCKLFSTEDELPLNQTSPAGRKPKIRGSDREWERLAGHESWSNSATLQHEFLSVLVLWWMFFSHQPEPGEKNGCTNDNFEVIYIYIVLFSYIPIYICIYL